MVHNIHEEYRKRANICDDERKHSKHDKPKKPPEPNAIYQENRFGIASFETCLQKRIKLICKTFPVDRSPINSDVIRIFLGDRYCWGPFEIDLEVGTAKVYIPKSYINPFPLPPHGNQPANISATLCQAI